MAGASATACYSTLGDGLLPTTGFITDPGCSPITLNSYIPRTSRVYSGHITEVRISQFEQDSSELGLVGVTNAVPEPSTWVMLLAGFAAMASALRRQGLEGRVRIS